MEGPLLSVCRSGPWARGRRAMPPPPRLGGLVGTASPERATVSSGWPGLSQNRKTGGHPSRRKCRRQKKNADVRLMPVAAVQGPHAPGPARVTGRLGIAQGLPDTQWHAAT
jgi:hypothetical protein